MKAPPRKGSSKPNANKQTISKGQSAYRPGVAVGRKGRQSQSAGKKKGGRK